MLVELTKEFYQAEKLRCDRCDGNLAQDTSDELRALTDASFHKTQSLLFSAQLTVPVYTSASQLSMGQF